MDETEFDDFYEASFRRVVGQLYAMIGDWDEATDCVQEAFVRAWQHRHALEQAAAPEAWVRTTAHRLAISRWRRVIRSRRAPDRALAGPAVVAGPDPDHVTVVAALAGLGDKQRQALVLHYLCDLPLAAIATQTGAPVGTVKARLSRGRVALLERLSDAKDGATHV